jgi:hypothetical protein
MTQGWCWPTPQQERLLRAALVADAATASAEWHAWVAGADLERLDEGSFRLLPLAYRSATARGLALSALLARLKGVHRQSWYKNRLLFRRIAHVVAALEAAGIATLMLKGIPLALLHYRDEGARPMSDGDVLVEPADLARAVQVLDRCGWKPRTSPHEWPPEPRASWPFRDGERDLDLHWRVFPIGCVSDAPLWAASVPLSVDGTPTRALAPADQLLHVIVHGLQWNPLPSIRWIADAVVVIRSAGGAFDWDRAIAQAIERRFVPALRLALEYLHDRLDVAVPAPVMARIRAHPSTRLDRMEMWSRLNSGVAAAVTRIWFDYHRLATEGAPEAMRPGLRKYLERRWMVAEGDLLPNVMARKVVGRWTKTRRPAHRA